MQGKPEGQLRFGRSRAGCVTVRQPSNRRGNCAVAPIPSPNSFKPCFASLFEGLKP
jgi:hypothetical protein